MGRETLHQGITEWSWKRRVSPADRENVCYAEGIERKKHLWHRMDNNL